MDYSDESQIKERSEALYNTAGVRVWLSKDFYSDYHRSRCEGDWLRALECVRSVWQLAYSRMEKEEREISWDLYNKCMLDIKGYPVRNALGNLKYRTGNFSNSIFMFSLYLEDILHKYKLGMPDKEDDDGL